MGQQLSTGLSESRGGQGPARSSLGGPGWPSHRGGGGPWQSRKPSDFWARERADVAATIAALLPHTPEPDYHKPERPSELDFSNGQNKRQGFVFDHNWNLNKF